MRPRAERRFKSSCKRQNNFVDMPRTYIEEDVSDESGCATREAFQHRVGQICQDHDSEGKPYVQGENYIVAFLLQRGAPASSLLTRMKTVLEFQRFMSPSWAGVKALGRALEQYFEGTIINDVISKTVTFRTIATVWTPALFTTAGFNNDSMEALFSLYLSCGTREESALLILRVFIHVFENSSLKWNELLQSDSPGKIMEWSRRETRKHIIVPDVLLIDVESVRKAYLQAMFSSLPA